jgi:uncharacterized protein YbaA (DUF1428 family)
MCRQFPLTARVVLNNLHNLEPCNRAALFLFVILLVTVSASNYHFQKVHMASNTKQKGGYVDGFVFVVPKNKVTEYRKMAQWGKRVWMKHGALDYKECVGDDLNIEPMGGMKPLSFIKLAKVRPSETVWFSFITYKSKAHRDQVNARVMKGMEEYHKDHPDHIKNMPFDVKRMAYGGFKVLVRS